MKTLFQFKHLFGSTDNSSGRVDAVSEALPNRLQLRGEFARLKPPVHNNNNLPIPSLERTIAGETLVHKINKTKLHLGAARLLISLILLMGMQGIAWGQTITYSQSFGTDASFPTNWANDGQLYTWSINSSNASGSYTGASGGSNLASGLSISNKFVTVSNLSTLNSTNVSILWGARRTYTNSVNCQWSSDGSTWYNLTFTDVTNNSTWALVNGGTRISLPPAANGRINLRIRWTYDSDGTAGRYRIDDFSVVATPAYAAQIISMNTGADTWCAEETRNVTVTVKNVGSAAWADESGKDFNVGLKWNTTGICPDNGSWCDYNVRTDALGLEPGATTTYTLSISASNSPGSTPLSAGSNNLTFDIVYEAVSWFGNNGGVVGPGNLAYVSPSITINALPSAPTGAATQTFCSGVSPTVVNLAAVGTNIKWYDAATGGNLLTTSTALVNGSHYYASQTATCESTSRLDVFVTVTSAPAVSSPVKYCLNATATSLAATGAGLLWYTAATGGTGSATAPTPSTTLAGTTSYYVSQTLGCESARTQLDVTIYTPVSTITNQTNITCYGGSNGSVEITASEGAAPYQYSVNNGETYTAGSNPYTYTGLSADVPYKIRVKDANNCTSPQIIP
jgi:hypothetical protein